MVLRVDVGVFAHNEAAGIAGMVRALQAQEAGGLDLRVVILANGCRDDTVAQARAAAAATPQIEVADLTQPGKSRTWNSFVHQLSRPDADVLIFVDADIAFPAPDCLARLALGLAARPALWVLNSQPVKDIQANPAGLSRFDKLIAAAGGGLDDWKTAICGQLYAMRPAAARRFFLPVGLPVEDGFLRAMVLTDVLTGPEEFSRIDGLDGLYHIYASERSLGALLRHQLRIVIGSAINAALFAELREGPADRRHARLQSAAADSDWVGAVLRKRLPAWPYGYVPVHFLTKRLVRGFAAPRSAKRLLVAGAGFGFDAIVYIWAQIRMARGVGAGFW
jgi:glycosyltransferase involved in cell wall biosynthesis